MPFIVTSKSMKYIGTNSLKKYAQDIYIESYRTLLRESKGDISKCWDIPCS